MKVGGAGTGERCHAAEGLSGATPAATFPRVGSLIDLAPAGRLFAAIATLTDMSAKAGVVLDGLSTRAAAPTPAARARKTRRARA